MQVQQFQLQKQASLNQINVVVPLNLSQIYTFVSAKAPNPNAAKIFTNWMLTAKGQLLLQKYGGLAATRPGTPPMAHLPATSSLSNVQDSLELTPPAKQKEIVDHWRKTFGIQ